MTPWSFHTEDDLSIVQKARHHLIVCVILASSPNELPCQVSRKYGGRGFYLGTVGAGP